MDDKDNDWFSIEQRDQRAHEYIMQTRKKRLIKRVALAGCVILTGIILVCITSRSPTAYQGGEEAMTPLIIPTEEIPRIEGITKSSEVPVTRAAARGCGCNTYTGSRGSFDSCSGAYTYICT